MSLQSLVITRQGSPLKITIPTQEIAADILDFILEAPSLDVIRLRRQEQELERAVSEKIALHIQEAIDSTHRDSPVKPDCKLTDL